MKTFMAFPICSIFFMLLVGIVFITKPKIKSIENSIYKWLLITNFIGLALELLCYYAVEIVYKNYLLSIGILKLYVIYIFVWTVIFNFYVFMVSYKNYLQDNESTMIRYKKLKKISIYSSLIISVVMLLLPIEVYNDGTYAYSYGPITNLLVIICAFLILSWFIVCIKNFKNLKQKRYIPIVACIIVLSFVFLIQSQDRTVLIATTGHSFILLLMFFTIENPDLKMIDELKRNRILVNKTVEEKSNFLFLTANQIKNPIENIEKISKEIMNINDINEIKENVKKINNLSHSLFFEVNNLMDISSLTNSNIKVVLEKYNLINLINKIKLLEEKKISDSIDFVVNISESVPKYLYGDSKLLQQILISILENSIKYTEKGFIELSVDAIVKYDMARLIFRIEDSGIGMSTSKVNELLMVDDELSENDLKRIDSNNVNINTIKKIASKLGGYFTIKSEENKGTEIKIVIDQKIEDSNKKIVNNNEILIATKDQVFLNSITKIINSYGYDLESSSYSNDVLDRIRLGENFSYIFIDDNMDKRAIEVLKELKKNLNFKTKVIVVLDEDMEIIKKHFIEDGFNDYIMKDNIEKDLSRILK